MINKFWIFFIISGSLFLLLNGEAEVLNSQIISSGKTALDLILQIFPLMALWLGIMNIASSSGLLDKVSQLISPFLSKLFPEIPKGHESLGLISSNMVANIFGLGNAATPFGIKAMQSMQQLNKKKDEASHSMITFLVINTCGLTIVPTTIISLRMMHDSADPTDIVLPCFIATFVSLVIGLIIDALFRRRDK